MSDAETTIRNLLQSRAYYRGKPHKALDDLLAVLDVLEPEKKVELPTTPGDYAVRMFLGTTNHIYTLGYMGFWWDGTARIEPKDIIDRRHHDMVQVRPVPETAKEVINFIASSWENGAPENVLEVLRFAQVEFGVED